MNYYIWETRTKMAVIRDYLEEGDSLSKLFVLGKSLKSIKKQVNIKHITS